MKRPKTRVCALALAASFVLTGGFFPGGSTALWAQDHAASAPSPANLTNRLVGELGDPERLAFEGLQTFSAETVRLGLLDNIDFLLASHPLAPLNDYLPALRNLVQAGYQNAGFPDARINTSLEAQNGRLLVKVSEGVRCQQAGIKITGAVTIPAELLRRRLTELPPSANPTNQSISERLHPDRDQASNSFHYSSSQTRVWDPGQPVSFGDQSLSNLTEGLNAALIDMGYFFSRTRVSIVPDRTNGTADLLIDVLDEGSSGVIGQINLTGLKRNRRAEVINYLGLKPGLPVNRELLKRTEDLLWRSARFLDFAVTPEIVPDRKHINLTIALTEFDLMPPLHQDLSRAAKALIRFGDWLSDEQSPGGDIVLTYGTAKKPLGLKGLATVQLILSPRGLLVAGWKSAANENVPPVWAAVADGETIGVYDLAQHSKLAFTITNLPLQLSGFVKILPNLDPAAGSHYSASVGGGFASLDDETNQAGTSSRPPFRMDRLLAPVVLAAQAYSDKKDFHSTYSKGLLHLTGKDYRLTIEETTGKLVEARALADGTNELQIHCESQAFDKALAQINRFSATDHNQADAKNPINSVLAFVLDEALRVESSHPPMATDPPVEKLRRSGAALEKLLAHGALAPLDAMVARQLSPPGSASFSIPVAPGPSAQSTTLSYLTPLVFRYGKDLLPQGSWPWLALRETALTLGNKGKYTDSVLQQIYESDQTGPLGFEILARLLNSLNSPSKVLFARRGLTRLSAADFRHDYQLFLDGDCVVQKCLANMVQGFAALNDGDVETLIGHPSPEVAALVRLSIQSLRQAQGKPLAETLAPVLNELWDTRLKQMVEADLLNILTPPPTNAPGR